MPEHENIPEETYVQPELLFSAEHTIESETPEIKNMEVHHHPHVEKKDFKEYLLEGLMIFVAVTLGFFAEGLRESISDNAKEKEYMESFVQNLADDTTLMRFVIAENKDKVEKMTKVMSLAQKDMSAPGNTKLLYKYCTGRSIGYYSIFKSNDATMLQLKNSGGLRLIRKDHVADSIAKYDNAVKIISAAEDLYTRETNEAIIAVRSVMDFTVFYDSSYFNNDSLSNKPIALLSDKPLDLKLFLNKVDLEIGATKNYINNMESRLPFTIRLIAFLKKEYDLE
jgi:hypothetical protein